MALKRSDLSLSSRQWLVFCLLSWLAVSAAAQTDDGWYQIEVLVFDQSAITGATPPQLGLQLSYPGNWRQLIDPDTPPNPLLAEQVSQAPTDDVESHHSLTLDQTAEGALVDEAIEEQPYRLLPAAERQLNGEARRLKQAGAYRVLYHQAWRQPLGNRASTAWILVRGGQQFGEHRELEGVLRIYLQRALFAQTHLWKTHFGSAQNTSVQDMRTQDTPTQDTPEPNPLARNNGFQAASEVLTLPPWPARFGGETPLFENLAREAAQTEQQDRWRDFSVQDSSSFSEGDAMNGAANLRLHDIERIASLDQTQRLELGETLYLDHPEVGVLIHVTRYQHEVVDDDGAGEL